MSLENVQNFFEQDDGSGDNPLNLTGTVKGKDGTTPDVALAVGATPTKAEFDAVVEALANAGIVNIV